MNIRLNVRQFRDACGQTLVEFALVAFMLIMVIFGVVEITRMVLVYTAIANAARAGTRYAIVHGSYSASPSGPADDPADVVTRVKNVAVTGTLNPASVTATVRYTNTTNTPGSVVKVNVSYPYDPLTRYFPITVTLTSTSQGVITF